jgi:FkbM family methyltransferase
MKITTLHRSISKRLNSAARFAGALGGSPRGRGRLFVQALTLPRNGTRPRRMRCCYGGREFLVHLFSFRELAPFLEVFAAGEYDGGWQHCRTIVDIGANIGAASLLFWLHAPQSRIIAIEPNQANLRRLKLNLAQIPGALIIEKALASHRGHMAFYRNDGFSLGSTLVGKRSGLVEDTVEAMTFADLLETLQVDSVDLCKFDIEGAEYDLFAQLEGSGHVRQFIGEFHEDLTHKGVADFLRLFPRHTTQAVQIAPQRFICRGRLNENKLAA